MTMETSLKPGDVVSVPVGFIKHVGIVIGYGTDGTPRVISNSLKRGCVAEESLADFSGGSPISIEPLTGPLPIGNTLQRAKRRLGESWSLFSFNCEHFVYWALGLEPKSPQLRFYGTTLALAMIPILASGR